MVQLPPRLFHTHHPPASAARLCVPRLMTAYSAMYRVCLPPIAALDLQTDPCQSLGVFLLLFKSIYFLYPTLTTCVVLRILSSYGASFRLGGFSRAKARGPGTPNPWQFLAPGFSLPWYLDMTEPFSLPPSPTHPHSPSPLFVLIPYSLAKLVRHCAKIKS